MQKIPSNGRSKWSLAKLPSESNKLRGLVQMRRNKSIPRPKRNKIAGLTLIELILTCGILLILSAAAIPMFKMTVQHRKESELHYDLREMRNAIDRYKDDADKNLIRTEVGSQNYPPDLQTLVDGVTVSTTGPGQVGVSAAALATASGTGQTINLPSQSALSNSQTPSKV